MVDMSGVYKFRKSVLWSIISVLVPILFIWSFVSVLSLRHRRWDESRCFIVELGNHTSVLGTSYDAYTYRDALLYVRSQHNITFEANGTVVCVSTNSKPKTCNWVIGMPYMCWIYNTYPQVPLGTLGVVIYFPHQRRGDFQFSNHNPNDMIQAIIGLISFLLVVLFVVLEVVSVVLLISAIKEYKERMSYERL